MIGGWLRRQKKLDTDVYYMHKCKKVQGRKRAVATIYMFIFKIFIFFIEGIWISPWMYNGFTRIGKEFIPSGRG